MPPNYDYNGYDYPWKRDSDAEYDDVFKKYIKTKTDEERIIAEAEAAKKAKRDELERLNSKVKKCVELYTKVTEKDKDYSFFTFTFDWIEFATFIANVTTSNKSEFGTLKFKDNIVAIFSFDVDNGNIKIEYSADWTNMIKGVKHGDISYKGYNKAEDFQFIIDFLEEQRFDAMTFFL